MLETQRKLLTPASTECAGQSVTEEPDTYVKIPAQVITTIADKRLPTGPKHNRAPPLIPFLGDYYDWSWRTPPIKGFCLMMGCL